MRASVVNKHGLSRNIPADVKRAVRQRDGFGCVVCGQAVIDYEHFDPKFAEAEVHAPAGIILLCIGCHGQKTRKRLSRETIRKHALKPKARQVGFSHGPFDVGEHHPEIWLGNVVMTNVTTIIQVHDDVLLSVKPPEEKGGPFRLNAYLTDRRGRLQLAIVDNEWQSPVSNWDVAVEGPRIAIRSGLRDIELVLRTDPPNRLVFERIRMIHKEFSIECREGSPTVFRSGDVSFSTYDATLDGQDIGVAVTEDGALCSGVGGGSMRLGQTRLSRKQSTPEPPDNVVPLFRK